MSDAVDVLHAIERLVALASLESGAGQEPLQEADAVLHRMGLANGATGYKAEQLVAVHNGFAARFGVAGRTQGGDAPQIPEGRLLRDIEHLRKALARGSEGQD